MRTAADQGAVSGKYVIQPGDVIYSKIRPALRKAMLSDFHGICSADMYPMRPSRDVDSRFLLATLLGNDFSRFADAISGRSGIPKVNRKELAEYYLPLPPLDEQRRIADVLDAIGSRIRQVEEVLAKQKVAAVAIAQQLIPVHPSPRQLGAGWRLASLSEVVSSADYGISMPLVVEGDGLPTLRMNNLTDGRIRVHEIKFAAHPVPEHLILKNGDVLFNRTNSFEHVGRTAMWRCELERATFASYLVRLNLDLREIMPGYLVCWLNQVAIQQRIRRLATPGVHQVNINPTSLRKTLIELPVDISSQRRIVAVLDECDRAAEAMKDELRRLQDVRQGLMNDMLTGRTPVPVDL
jgi:type I restriction enzyme S subunit